MQKIKISEVKDSYNRTGSDVLFKLTMLVIIVHAGFILWDFITLIPAVETFLKIKENV